MARKRKVKLPVDAKETPIHIGDIVAWGDGTVFRVDTMTYFGDGRWTIEGQENPDEDWSDNPGGCKVIWRSHDKR